MEGYCLICGSPYSEEHHVIFRGQQSAMIKCPLNIIHLCHIHHRGNESPHNNREIDLKYKKDLQEKLESLFSYKECYKEEEVKNILLIHSKDVRKLLKPLCVAIINKEIGYRREEIIKQCLGGRMYD